MIRRPPKSTLFPSPPLFRSRVNPRRSACGADVRRRSSSVTGARCEPLERCDKVILHVIEEWGDRKSTRLNSSHLVISYAVFCLKKKKNKTSHGSEHLQNHCD